MQEENPTVRRRVDDTQLELENEMMGMPRDHLLDTHAQGGVNVRLSNLRSV